MKPLRIVLAEDHEVVRTGLKALVDASPGLTVVGEAGTGDEAVELACRLQPDVVVMDITMPVLDGVGATVRLSRECPDVRVLVLTAHEDRAHLTRLLQAGAAGYVLKRAAADDLVRAIRQVAEGRTYVDPVLAGALLSAVVASPRQPLGEAAGVLSEREEDVLRRIAWGHSNKEIAQQLAISTKTVETYRARIADKLQLRRRTDMVRYALERGWLSEE